MPNQDDPDRSLRDGTRFVRLYISIDCGGRLLPLDPDKGLLIPVPFMLLG
jgi:hypothetical protein